jgi:hypothetical protein
MRDGVKLATDVYRPARDGEAIPEKLPTLLCRTPYGKHLRPPTESGYGCSETTATFFARHGYVVVVQDIRGRYESEGTFYPYVNEGPDGYDAVEWAAGQPWSNGDVGTFGASYYAATQMALAVESPPHLKAMMMRVGTSNYWEDGAGSGGAFALRHNLAYALVLASESQEAYADPPIRTALLQAQEKDELSNWLLAYPFRIHGSPLAVIPSYGKWFQDWVDHSSFDDYWKQNGYNFELYHDKIPDVPIFLVGGWYDIFLRGTLRNYTGLSAIHQSSTQLMVGAWTHGVGPRSSGDVDFGDTAAVDLDRMQISWFDQVLKGKDTALQDGPPVKLLLMGGGDGTRNPEGRLNHGGEWVSLSSWPPEETRSMRYYLQSDGGLSAAPPASSQPSVYTFDPTDPVPTIGGKVSSGNNVSPAGPYDQRCIEGKFFPCKDNLPLSARRDVLVFQTPPLEEDVVIVGPITVKLWASSIAADTDFTAKLVDAYPPSPDYPRGYDMLLADGIVRARFRNSLEKPELLEPEEIVEVTIDLLGIANRFQKGHRIRLDISSSNFPFYDVNPNTGERPGHHPRRIPAVNTLYHDPDHPSHILLSVFRRPGS